MDLFFTAAVVLGLAVARGSVRCAFVGLNGRQAAAAVAAVGLFMTLIF
jgi:hypothetical protein